MKHISTALPSTCLILTFILCPTPTGAQTVFEKWVRSYNGPGNSGDQANAVVVDTNGNAFVTGHSAGTNGDLDYLTIKYSGAGAPVWTNRYSGPGNSTDMANALVVNKNGNVIVTGSSETTRMFDADYVTIMYSDTGVPLWTNRYTGPVTGGNDVPRAIAVDANGDVFVTGASQSRNNPVEDDYATIKYSGATGTVLWIKRSARGSTSHATGIAVDNSGNVVVTGTAHRMGNSWSIITSKHSGATGVELFTKEFSLGNLLTYKANNARPKVALDSSGNVIVTGSLLIPGSGDSDYATIKYSGLTGAQVWSQFYDGSAFGATTYRDDVATAIAVGTNGNVFVTGYSAGSDTTNDFLTIAYFGTTGTPLWTNRYNGSANGNDDATAIALDGRNNVCVTGYSAGSGSANDFVTIAYATTGISLWTNRYNGPASGDDAALAMAANSSGNVFVTGLSAGTNGYYDYATVNYEYVPVTSPNISNPPASRTNLAGTTATFTVTATGTEPLRYRWRKGTAFLPNVGRLSGTTNTTLTISNVMVSDVGSYSVVITNLYGAVTSSVAVLTVWSPPKIGYPPSSQTNYVGTTALFSVTASGTSPLSYRWWAGGNALSNGGNMSGTTTAELILSSVATNEAGDYCVVVTNPYGAVTSSMATLTVIQSPPEIVQAPAGGFQPAGSDFTFSVTARGAEPMSYQWQRNGLDIPESTATNYTRSNLTLVDSGDYTVVITNFLGSVTSSVAKLTVGYPPVVVDPPHSSTNFLCRTTVLSCNFTGALPMNLQWLFNSARLVDQTNSTLTLTNLQASNEGYYALSATNAFGGTVSTSARLLIFGAGGVAVWRTTGALAIPRCVHTTTALPPGNVLVAGGFNGDYLSSVELYDSASGLWIAAGPMSTVRGVHTATLLLNGKVLVSGGANSSSVYSSAEIYDPSTGTWAGTGTMNTSRGWYTATLLPNGKVLAAGGQDFSGCLFSAELYDPASGTWATTGALNTVRLSHTATLLPNGKVLAAGGQDFSGCLFSAELYDPASGMWTATSTLTTERTDHTATLLPNGKVLIAGGFNSTSGYLSSAELYDPDTGTSALTVPLNNARRVHTTTLLPNGLVLVAGGEDSSGYLFSAELYESSQAAIAVALGNLAQPYDGTAKSVSVRTTPHGLPVDVTYNGSANAPTNSGSYTAIGTINDPCYQISATNTLVIYPAASTLTGATILTNGTLEFTFVNSPGVLFSVLTTTNLSLPLSNWMVLGGVTEVSPGQYQFTDPQVTNMPERFYRVRSP